MLQPNQVLCDRYQLHQKLGQNAGRQTWLATDQTDGQSVVVKLLAFADQVNWETLKLFEREAAILRQLDHPHIPKYRDYFSIDDRVLWFGLVHDYIPGTSLKEHLIQGQRFTQTQVQTFAQELLAILIYLHELSPPVLHRDIKPGNIILGRDQRLYLIDFGAVQDKAAVEGASFTVVGTYGYAPMEQFGGRTVAASDLYALGATLIHLLTGTAPADLPQPQLRMQFAHLASLDAATVRWLAKLTEPSPPDRFATARQALEALTNPEPESPIASPLTRQLARSQPAAPRFCHAPPAGTQVKLRYTRDRLEIQYPITRTLGCAHIMALGLLLTMGTCYTTAVISNASGFWLIVFIIAAIAGLFNATAPKFIHIRFEQHLFVISRIYGWIYQYKKRQIAQGRTTEITEVVRIEQENGHRATFSLQTIRGEYAFEPGNVWMSREECQWVMQEIRHWLNESERNESEP